MSYNSTAYIYVTNNFTGNANITLHHAYSDDPSVSQTWNNVAPGKAGSPPQAAGYNTGFIRTGMDHWAVEVQVLDGSDAGRWAVNSKQCTLSSADNNKTLTFSVSSDSFVLTEISGTCSSSWDEKP